MPGFDTHGDSEIAHLGCACNGTSDFGKVSFGSEASLFDGAAIPTVICGPGHIAQAHQPDEWVSLAQLAQCESFMLRLADRVCYA
jgi:acetylornithine deacetylase